jgi:hypothetical protein
MLNARDRTPRAPKSFIVGGPYFIENATRTALDELRLYSRCLSADEIESAYRRLTGAAETAE